MLPFHHVRGYTLFTTAKEIGGRWVGLTRVHKGSGLLLCFPTAKDFDTHHAARVRAAIDAAGLANTIRTVG